MERESKLNRYRFAVRTDEPDAAVTSFDFAYHAPNHMRGRLYRPRQETLSFDGETFYQVLPDQKRFRRLRLPAMPAERALRLSERFAPFVPEGFRTPLLPWRSVHAAAVAHPRAPEAVALTAQVTDDAGKPLKVTYTVRWPSGDFLVKRVEGSDGVAELRTDDEQCEARLGVCVPLRLSRWKNGAKVGTTELLELELFESPPNEEFTLRPPEGYAQETAEL
jgi:hypothetical protein